MFSLRQRTSPLLCFAVRRFGSVVAERFDVNRFFAPWEKSGGSSPPANVKILSSVAALSDPHFAIVSKDRRMAALTNSLLVDVQRNFYGMGYLSKLAMVTGHLSKRGYYLVPLLKAIATSSSPLIGRSRIEEISKLVNGFARAEYRAEALFGAIQRHRDQLVETGRASEVFLILDGYATLGVHAPLLFSTAARAAGALVRDANGPALAKGLRAFRKAGLPTQPFIRELVRNGKRIGSCTKASSLATLSESLAEANSCPLSFFGEIEINSQKIVGRATLHDLSRLLVTLTKARVFSRGLFCAVERKYVRHRENLDAIAHSQLLHALAEAGVKSKVMVEGIQENECQLCESPTFMPSVVLRSFALMGVMDEFPETVERLWDLALSKWSDCKEREPFLRQVALVHLAAQVEGKIVKLKPPSSEILSILKEQLLKGMSISHQCETAPFKRLDITESSILSVDIELVDLATHKTLLNGISRMKTRLLNVMGYSVIRISVYEWGTLSSRVEKERFLLRKIKAHS